MQEDMKYLLSNLFLCWITSTTDGNTKQVASYLLSPDCVFTNWLKSLLNLLILMSYLEIKFIVQLKQLLFSLC